MVGTLKTFLAGILCAILLTAHVSAATSLAGQETRRKLQGQEIIEPLIVGGEVVKEARYPYAAIIFDDKRAFCSGFLIHPQVIATAAHCTEGFVVGAKIGTRNWLLDDIYGRKYYARMISQSIKHPDYEKLAKRKFLDRQGDLALMILSSPVPSNVPVIQLPNNTTKIPDKLQTIGYGTTSEGGSKMSSVLRSVGVDKIKLPECNKLLNKIAPRSYNVTNAHICAGVLAGGKDSCQGDSGGPLLIRGKTAWDDIAVGITAFGEGCARKNAPAGYSNLVTYGPWIEKQLRILVRNEVIQEYVRPPSQTGSTTTAKSGTTSSSSSNKNA